MEMTVVTYLLFLKSLISESDHEFDESYDYKCRS